MFCTVTRSKKQLLSVSLYLFLLLLALPAVAANHYVRQGATGSGSGSDWINACTGFSGSCAVSSMVRGDTYYVAAGTYTSQTWNQAASGSLIITIKKATVADHGTDTGWNSAYAAQATFTERNVFSTPYWVFDGQDGDYATGGLSSYGFKEQYSVGDYATTGGTTGGGFQFQADNVTIRYVDCSGYTGTGDYNYPNQAKCIEAYGGNNWTVSHLAMHGCESCLQGGGNNWVVENSYIYNSRSVASNFHNNIFWCSPANGGTFRYNRIWDYNAEGFFITGWSGTVTNVAIYGNVFSDTGAESNYPRGIELRQDYSYSNILMYNNTFYNLNDGGINDLTPSTGNTCTGCQVIDNIGVLASIGPGPAITANNNTDDSNSGRFVNATTRDFHLTGALDGAAMAAPYNLDMDGNTRGAGGVWDRGAYEYVTASSGKPAAPTGLSASVR